MKNLFAILLMLILPLQFSYATASAYCADERPSVPEHYGHHDHEGAQAAFKAGQAVVVYLPARAAATKKARPATRAAAPTRATRSASSGRRQHH